MSDERDDGTGTPSGPGGPPPLAAPVPPAAPQAAPPVAPAAAPGWPQAYAPPPRSGLNAGWIVAGVLALLLVVLAILYFTGVFDRAPSRPLPGSDGAGGFGGSAQGNDSLAAPSARAPSGPEPATGGVPTIGWLTGSWGPRCPGSREDVATFNGDGSFVSRNRSDSWTIVGYDVVLYGNGPEVRTRWFALGPNSARVTVNGQTSYVYRCP